MRILLILLTFITTLSFAQQTEVKLYPGTAPGSESWNWQEKVSDTNAIKQRLVYNVAQPTLTVFQPDPSVANGTAVVICPGGGFYFLSINSEGFDVARWLAKKGVTAFVLKYRLVQTKGKDPVQEYFVVQSKKENWEAATSNIIPLSVADGRAAIAWVRKNAANYHIDPKRIGIIGFSAGGTVAGSAAFNYTPENKPDFVAPIYAYLPSKMQSDPASDAPPLFIACASDDQIGLQVPSIELYQRWNNAKKPVEMHLYAKGGHGFGMQVHHIATDTWIERFGDWLGDLGMLGK